MSFKFINASATCQQMINNALKNLFNVTVIAYLDNILIYSENLIKYEKHVKQVFKHLIKYNLQLKPEKCK